MKTTLIFLLLACLICVTTYAQTGPGGVGNSTTNKLWFDANAMTGLSEGAPLGTWQDRSGNSWNAVQTLTANKPIFLSNQLNGNPVIRFSRTVAIQYLQITAAGVGGLFSNSNTVFVVAK